MKKITFKFRDSMSNWEWVTQQCTVESINEFIRIYGLNNFDVEYEIISVEEVEDV